MKANRYLLWILIAATALCFPASAEISAGEWIQRYNELAPSVGAQTFQIRSGHIQSEEGVHVYFFSEKSYIAVYVGSGGNADAVIVEIRNGDFDVKAMTAASIAASDASVTPERAFEILTEAEAELTEEAGERYSYLLSDGWIVMLSDMTIGANRYMMYTVIRESAYDEIMGEEESAADENGGDGGAEEQPEEKAAPETEKKHSDKEIYKI